MRFLVQWLASERQGESIIPVPFWYWSIAGSAVMCIYFIFRRDPVGILAYLPNSLIYIRNLMLIRKRKFAFTAAAPSQHRRAIGAGNHQTTCVCRFHFPRRPATWRLNRRSRWPQRSRLSPGECPRRRRCCGPDRAVVLHGSVSSFRAL